MKKCGDCGDYEACDSMSGGLSPDDTGAENCDGYYIKCGISWNGPFAHCISREKDGTDITVMIHNCMLEKHHKGQCNCSCGGIK